MKLTKIKAIKKISEKYKRYDIQTEKSNNFFANDLLVHNSLIQVAWYNVEHLQTIIDENTPGYHDHELVVTSSGSFDSWHSNRAEQLLAHLCAQPSENQGVREFVQILGLHREYQPTLIEQAISQALTYCCAHLNGVRLCLWQLQYPEPPLAALDLTHQPKLDCLGQQPLDLHHYEHLLAASTMGETL